MAISLGLNVALRLTGAEVPTVAPSGAAPVNVSTPSISGSVYVGMTLTAAPGTWANDPTAIAYQWNADSTPIPGAVSLTYALTSSELGKLITFSETASNAYGSTTAVSAQTAAVQNIPTLATLTLSASTIAENSAAGTVVGSVEGLTSGSSLVITSDAGGRFELDETNRVIAGSVSTDYETATSHSITLRETLGSASNSPNDTTLSVSVTDVSEVVAPTNTAAPSITGTANIGQTLTASTGTWTGSPTSYTYQWYGNGAPIYGATSSTYVLTSSEYGETIKVGVIATNSYGSSAATRSSATSAVGDGVTYLVNDSFSSGVGTWTTDSGSAVVHNTSIETPDFFTGCAALQSNSQNSYPFTAPTSGKMRIDFFLRDDTTTTGASATTATTHFYIRLNTSAVSSANSAAYVAFNRNTASGATSTTVALDSRNGASFVTQALLRRDGQAWWRIGIVLDIDANTYDIYINDVLYQAGFSFPSTTKSTTGNITVAGGTTAPVTYFDDLKIQTGWALPTESVLVSDDFTVGTSALSSTSPTDSRNVFTQKWVSPTTTAVGPFTRSANGLTYTKKATFGLFRCGYDGIYEARFKTSAASGRYAGIVLRAWEGPNAGYGTGDAMYVFRYASGSATQMALFGSSGSSLATLASRATPSMTISAGDIIDMKVEARGRYIYCYVRNVTTSGSYELQCSLKMIGSSTGARGLLCQENAGPYMDGNFAGVGTDNYCTSFSYTGRKPFVSDTSVIGSNTYNVELGSVKELYLSGSGESTTNIFWDRGIQFGHRAEMDMAESFSGVRKKIINAENVKVYRQRATMMAEDAFGGVGDCHVTLLRRGPWVSDRVYLWGSSVNWAPDNDFRPGPLEAYGTYKVITSSGTITTPSHTGYHDWRTDGTSTPTVGFQVVASYSSGNTARLTEVARNVSGASGLSLTLNHKCTGSAAPISIASGPNSGLSDATTYEIARAWFLETGSGYGVDSTRLTDFWNDVKAPATLGFTTGSAKENATGDVDTDGFNERFGWYEINCASGAASFSMTISSGTRHMPAFRLNSHTVGPSPTVSINSLSATHGIDYVWDDLADGTGILQLLANYTSTFTVNVT